MLKCLLFTVQHCRKQNQFYFLLINNSHAIDFSQSLKERSRISPKAHLRSYSMFRHILKIRIKLYRILSCCSVTDSQINYYLICLKTNYLFCFCLTRFLKCLFLSRLIVSFLGRQRASFGVLEVYHCIWSVFISLCSVQLLTYHSQPVLNLKHQKQIIK